MRRLLVLAATGALAAQSAKEFVGAGKCGACHPEQTAAQAEGGHARSLQRAAEHPLARSFAPATVERAPNFLYQFSTRDRSIWVRASAGGASAELPVEWAFGAGDQAVTFVSRLDQDRYLEHHLSYYRAPGKLDATPGHAGRPAKDARDALGVIYRTFDPEPKIMQCFQCHSTGRLQLGPDLQLEPSEAGVRCEACHGAGSLHLEAAQRSDLAAARALIDNPRRLTAAGMNELCGNCHRKPAPAGAATNWNEPWNARHQPLYLAESACFRRSAGKLSCRTCHDPHRPLRRAGAAYYNGLCAGCHRKPHPPLRAAKAAADCVRCHMPAVRPMPHLRFANHWIGVYREGSALRPVRRR